MLRLARLFASVACVVLLPTLGLAQEAAADPAARVPRPPSSTSAGNFLSRVNEFMMVRAKDHPEWWMDQRVYRENTAIPPEFIVIVAARGSFLARVRNFKDLPAEQKAAVLEDPMWHSFLRAKRDKGLYPGTSSIYARSTPTPEGEVPVVGLRENEQSAMFAVTIDPAEMVLRRPVEIRVAGTRRTEHER